MSSNKRIAELKREGKMKIVTVGAVESGKMHFVAYLGGSPLPGRYVPSFF